MRNDEFREPLRVNPKTLKKKKCEKEAKIKL